MTGDSTGLLNSAITIFYSTCYVVFIHVNFQINGTFYELTFSSDSSEIILVLVIRAGEKEKKKTVMT